MLACIVMSCATIWWAKHSASELSWIWTASFGCLLCFLTWTHVQCHVWLFLASVLVFLRLFPGWASLHGIFQRRCLSPGFQRHSQSAPRSEDPSGSFEHPRRCLKYEWACKLAHQHPINLASLTAPLGGPSSPAKALPDSRYALTPSCNTPSPWTC